MAYPGTYLTCTVAQAAEHNAAHPGESAFVSLTQLLRAGAETHPHTVLAGFPRLQEDGTWTVDELTYASLASRANALAARLTASSTLCARKPEDKGERTAALLAPSGEDFLVAVVALWVLGYGVLLIAPQNAPDAIAHLCRATSATHILVHAHTAASQLGRALSSASADLPARVDLPPTDAPSGDTQPATFDAERDFAEDAERTAVIVHTSGSTGMPKPIYQTHAMWTSALPGPSLSGPPAFTTTPLFHGGMSDLLRALNALTPLYVFPSTYAITADALVGALGAIDARLAERGADPVRAFLSVPYVLALLDDAPAGREMLGRMDFVSTGGAPLAQELGDAMVARGVRLVSRLGSSEASFLMSSERDYAEDREWSWLRNESELGRTLLRFEQAPGGEALFELVVDGSWPTLAVRNRPDGAFATGDLYAPHPSRAHTWAYAGRADDTLVLANGKKVRAGPLEAALRASPAVAEAVLFGAGRAALGALVLPSAGADADAVRAAVRELNAKGAAHAEIVDELVVVLDGPGDAERVPRASKGTVLRPKMLQAFRGAIDAAYARLEGGSGEDEAAVVDDDALPEYVRKAVERGLPDGVKVGDDDDLFVAGVTSLRAAQIRGALQRALPPGAGALRGNVVFEHPSIRRLIALLRGLRSGEAGGDGEEGRERAEIALMREMVERFGQFSAEAEPARTESAVQDSKPLVIITGATGSLGAHLIEQFLRGTELDVVLLVRASDNEHAAERVRDALRDRGLEALAENAERVQCFAVDLAHALLGLDEGVYRELEGRATVVVHAAWAVNFVGSLESFTPHLRGLRNLLDLTLRCAHPTCFIFCSSVAAVLNAPAHATISESLSPSPDTAKPLGYARSKWVAEHICARAHAHAPGHRVAVARIGQLCGDEARGAWSADEGWPMLMCTAGEVGCLPLLDEHPAWLPVDIAARALVEIAQAKDGAEDESDDAPVFHVLNTNVSASWPDILEYLRAAGMQFESVPPAEWLARLNAHAAAGGEGKRNLRLLDMWNRQYGSKNEGADAGKDGDVLFETARIRAVAECMRELPPVGPELIRKCVEYWRACGNL